MNNISFRGMATYFNLDNKFVKEEPYTNTEGLLDCESVLTREVELNTGKPIVKIGSKYDFSVEDIIEDDKLLSHLQDIYMDALPDEYGVRRLTRIDPDVHKGDTFKISVSKNSMHVTIKDTESGEPKFKWQLGDSSFDEPMRYIANLLINKINLLNRQKAENVDTELKELNEKIDEHYESRKIENVLAEFINKNKSAEDTKKDEPVVDVKKDDSLQTKVLNWFKKL